MTIRKMLSDLAALPMSDADIGREIGAAASIIQRLRHGTHITASYERGKAIEALHKRLRPDLAAPTTFTRSNGEVVTDQRRPVGEGA